MGEGIGRIEELEVVREWGERNRKRNRKGRFVIEKERRRKEGKKKVHEQKEKE